MVKLKNSPPPKKNCSIMKILFPINISSASEDSFKKESPVYLP